MSNERWAVIDCGKYPSENNCQLKMSAPESHLEDLIEASASHAVSKHGHPDSQELRSMLRQSVQFESS
jgi:Protein of unknown function (DUF1059)